MRPAARLTAAVAAALVVGGCAPRRPSPTPTERAMAADDDASTGWPVAVAGPGGDLVVYQPQPQSLTGNQLHARAALALRPAPPADGTAAAPAEYGVAWVTARVNTDRDTHRVTLDQLRVTRVRLLGVAPADQQAAANDVAAQLSQMTVDDDLDRFTASLDTAQDRRATAGQVSHEPPAIVFSPVPATLVTIDGEPKLQPVEGQAGVSRVTNTPFVLLRDDAGSGVRQGPFYLKEGTAWAAAPAVAGPWTADVTPPPDVSAAGAMLTTDSSSAPATTAPADRPTTASADLAPAAVPSKLVVATTPTALIVTRGDPQFAPVPGGDASLLYAVNTSADLFLDRTARRYDVLLSGRWFAATSLSGPWQSVASDALPPAFARVPADSPKGSVLTFVAGTAQARNAVLDAAVPQTATVRRDAGADLSVDYDGPPQFEPVAGCPGLTYAVNTPAAVLAVPGAYYCCHQAVWYRSATPAGPWAVTAAVPDVIYTIPPSNPLYDTTFVRVYGSTPDAVDVGYTPGYTGDHVDGPTVCYGTGYAYAGWAGGAAYFPEPVTYGFDPAYDADAGLWGFDWCPALVGDGVYGGWFCRPFAGGRWWHDHPGSYGGWHRWWGPGGYLDRRSIRGRLAEAGGFGPYPGLHRGGGRPALDAGGHDLAAHLPGDEFHEPGYHNLYARPGNAARNAARNAVVDRSSLHFARPLTGERNDVVAGADGDVFRRDATGWAQRTAVGDTGGTWQAPARTVFPEARPNFGYTATPTARPAYGFGQEGVGVERDFGARAYGADRAAHFGDIGGGFHGGGGRR